MNTVLYKNIT